jgi:S-adenosylmethionine synthetase
MYEKFESNITDIFDKHVPVKEKYCRKNQLPYMNRELRKAIYNKKMFYSKFLKNKNAKTWEKAKFKVFIHTFLK